MKTSYKKYLKGKPRGKAWEDDTYLCQNWEPLVVAHSSDRPIIDKNSQTNFAARSFYYSFKRPSSKCQKQQ